MVVKPLGFIQKEDFCSESLKLNRDTKLATR